MAEVLLARVDGIEGFERHVVIKRIKSEQARDARFVQMFLDEARLAASLHHHNIVPVHDIGQEDGEYFFAMEYVHGEDLRRLLMLMAERDKRVPYEHCITIALSVAAALHHAHEHRGLGIVHRDVSPANILVGYDGNVKVVDFGIAKVAQSTTETQVGEMKGKVAYMSPEQCLGQAVDRRSDIFCLGIVLYELVTVRRLFKEDNDFLTMTAITRGVIPRPSVFRPDIAPALEAIILKALSPQLEQRYQTADEMRAALEQFAASAKLQTSATALADYMRAELGDRPVPWLVPDDDELEVSIDFDGSASGIVSAPDPALAVPEGAPQSPIMRARTKAITDAPPVGVQRISASFATTDSGARPPFGGTPQPWHARLGKRGWVIAGTFWAIAIVVGIAIARSGGDDAQPPAQPAAVVETPAVQPVAAPAQPREPEPATPPNLVPTSASADLGSAATVDRKPVKKKPVKKPPKGVWDPKALLPPK